MLKRRYVPSGTYFRLCDICMCQEAVPPSETFLLDVSEMEIGN